MSLKPSDILPSTWDLLGLDPLESERSARGSRQLNPPETVQHFTPFRPTTMAPGQCVYFDVDSTLVFAEDEAPDADLSPENWLTICGRDFYRHVPHCNAVRDFKARGIQVVVWSAGGAQWAAAVVQALGLTNDVDFCLTKPNWIFDDKSASVWLGDERLSYKEPK